MSDVSSSDPGPVAHLFLSLFEEEPEAFVFLDPGRQLPLTLLPRLLQLHLQLPQHVELLRQPSLPRPGHLQVQFQVQGGPQKAVQTFDLQRGLREDREGRSQAADLLEQHFTTKVMKLTFSPSSCACCVSLRRS